VTTQGRLPPHNADAEAAVISACVLDQDGVRGVVDDVRAVMDAEACYSDANRHIMRAIYALHDEGRPYDQVAVLERLRADGRDQQVGGSKYIVQTVHATPAIANPAEHARTVADLHRVRRAISLATRITGEGYGTLGEATGSERERVQAWLAENEQAFADITHEREQAKLRPMREVMSEVLTNVTLAHQQRTAVTGVPSGFTDLDKLTTGAHAGDLSIIAARPGMGKTALALCKVLGEARQGYAKPVFSLEMPARQLGLRLLAIESGVDMKKLRSGSYAPEEWVDITTAIAALSELPIFIDDTPAVTVFDVRARVRLLQRECAAGKHPGVKQGVGPVTIDYLQLMGAPGRQRYANREQEVGANSRELKRAAKELDVAFDVLAQLNREPEKRPDKKPRLSDLRESGSVEQDADNVLFLFRPGYYKPEDRELRTEAEVIVAKQRNGPTGSVRLRWTASTARFDSDAGDGYGDVDAGADDDDDLFGDL
jgi:replicative DNA helicase